MADNAEQLQEDQFLSVSFLVPILISVEGLVWLIRFDNPTAVITSKLD